MNNFLSRGETYHGAFYILFHIRVDFKVTKTTDSLLWIFFIILLLLEVANLVQVQIP